MELNGELEYAQKLLPLPRFHNLCQIKDGLYLNLDTNNKDNVQAKTSVILRCDVDVLVIYHMAKSNGANKQYSKRENTGN